MTQTPDPHREKRVELILQQLEELPTLPSVAVKVLEATVEGATTTSTDVVRLIGSDPVLTARILQLVHRADLGVRGEINSIERAVQILGFEAVRSAVLAISVFETMGGESQPVQGHFSREEFWKHCVAVACAAELLAAVAGELSPSEAFICGLLHDLGKVALDAILPKSFSRVVEAADMLRGNIADLESTIIGLDHMIAGKRLAERWQLPLVIRDCAWLHGQHPHALPSSVRQPRMVNLITLADLLVREQHLGYSGNYTFGVSRQPLLESCGLTQPQVEHAMAQLVDQIEPRARALGLGQASSGELYQQALAQANRELGRVSGQLAAKNRRLSVRAKFFDALSRFQAELHPDAPPSTVLSAIAQTATGVVGVDCVAVFSLPPSQDYAEVIFCDGKGDVFGNSLIDLPVGGGSTSAIHREGEAPAEPSRVQHEKSQNAAGATAGQEPRPPIQSNHAGRPSKGSPGDGPVMACGQDMDWFVNAVSPRLPHEKRFWVCLEADGACVGGVVWGAPAGESQRLSTQVQELAAIANGWSLALRTAQIREEARSLAEQLAEANRRLHTAQSEILRSKMMVTIGEMAAGAAHEMNNPLAVISGRSQLLSLQLSDPKQKASAQLVFEQSHRLSGMITDLMEFAKPEPPTVAESALPEILGKALQEAKMQHNPSDRQVEVTMGEVPAVMVDARQVAGALQEVIDNALQATDPVKGHVSIHAAFDPYSSRVVLTVSDDGCGMDEETLKRAFDPFFSSKKAGRRRGMGLAKALRWVEASGGSIRLESRPNLGTRTVLLLPAAGGSVGTTTATEDATTVERKRRIFNRISRPEIWCLEKCMLPIASPKKLAQAIPARKTPPRVLIVEDEPALVEIVNELLQRDMNASVISAQTIAEATRLLSEQQVDLVITDINLPDGNGMSLLPAIRKYSPSATAIVMTGAPTMDFAISAIRSGAVDFVPKPFGSVQILDHVKKALDRQALIAREDRRVERLREAVRRLNASRRTISKKVDLLCNDLVTAYGELSRQLDGVRTQESFRKYVESAKDLEQLLCHAMDWLLREMGYSNVAVWLTSEDGEFQLGAYMKYTAAGEHVLTEAMKRVILPMATRDTLVHINGDDIRDQFSVEEFAFYKGQDILAVNSTYLGESLASMVFFRDARSPFIQEYETLLKAISPIFAVALASAVRGSDNEAGHEDSEEDGPFMEKQEDAPGGITDPSDQPLNRKKKDKIDPADWWKRGESPPF